MSKIVGVKVGVEVKYYPELTYEEIVAKAKKLNEEENANNG